MHSVVPLGLPGHSPVSVDCDVGKAGALLCMKIAELNVFRKSHQTYLIIIGNPGV